MVSSCGSKVAGSIPEPGGFSRDGDGDLFSPAAPSLPSDFRHPGERPVRRHDGQGEAAALVPADGGGIPGPALRQLHQQLEGREALQRHHTQAQVRLDGRLAAATVTETFKSLKEINFLWSVFFSFFFLLAGGTDLVRARLPVTCCEGVWGGVWRGEEGMKSSF